MQLEQLEKHIHITQLPAGVEVMFAGQPCLNVMENSDGYFWRINPLFAKLAYGANVFDDVPFCMESVDTIEEAIALGLESLHELGAFSTAVDLPEDSYVEEHLDESVQLDESTPAAYVTAKKYSWGTMKHVNVGHAFSIPMHPKHHAAVEKMEDGATHRFTDETNKQWKVKRDGDNLNFSHRDVGQTNVSLSQLKSAGTNESVNEGAIKDIENKLATHAKFKSDFETKYGPMTGADLHQHEVLRTQLLNKKKKAQYLYNKKLNNESVEEDNSVEEFLVSLMEDCRAEALKHSTNLLEAHDLAQGLFESFVEEYLNELSKDTLKSYHKKAVDKLRTGDVLINKFDKREKYAMKAYRKAYDQKNEELNEETVIIHSPGHKLHGKRARVFHTHADGSKNVQISNSMKKGDVTNLTLKSTEFKPLNEELNEQAKYRRDDLEGKAHKTWTDDDGSEHKEGMDGPETGDELNRRSIHGTEKRVKKDGTITKSEKYAQGTLKSLIKFNKKLGGLSGPKGRLPESVDEAYGATKKAYDPFASAISKVMSRPAFSAPTKDEPQAPAPKKKTGRPSNGPDADELRERMKENMKDGKRLHHGFERKDKVKAIRANIHKEVVFGDYHTGKAGRTVGTTKEAQAAKAEENKKTKLDNVFGRWSAGVK